MVAPAPAPDQPGKVMLVFMYGYKRCPECGLSLQNNREHECDPYALLKRDLDRFGENPDEWKSEPWGAFTVWLMEHGRM